MTGQYSPGVHWPVATLQLVRRLFRAAPATLLFAAFLAVAVQIGETQTSLQTAPYERNYPQSKIAVERALEALQPYMGGRLPVLDGFASPGDHPLSHYQRAYYQSSVQVAANASGGSVVRVNTKVTAWYTDSIPSHSGYQLLMSNGRLESDLLDQLDDLLARNPRETDPGAGKPSAEPAISAPTHQSPETEPAFSSSREQSVSRPQRAEIKKSPNNVADQETTSLRAEAASLEEVLKNQAHPKNLVAIKKTGTPVVASPSLNGKTLFLASAHDEFEMLDFNADWVHVRISGLSRGWIWRTSLEMPDGISDIPTAGAAASPVAADLFQVTREETAPFPGDWDALRGKNVKIISVQKIHEDEKNSGAQAKLEFTKSLLDKNYSELAAKAEELAGVVMIFDSVDGGMIAITQPTVQQWKAGRLTDAALWHRCYFDPPETFSAASSSGDR